MTEQNSWFCSFCRYAQRYNMTCTHYGTYKTFLLPWPLGSASSSLPLQLLATADLSIVSIVLSFSETSPFLKVQYSLFEQLCVIYITNVNYMLSTALPNKEEFVWEVGGNNLISMEQFIGRTILRKMLRLLKCHGKLYNITFVGVEVKIIVRGFWG